MPRLADGDERRRNGRDTPPRQGISSVPGHLATFREERGQGSVGEDEVQRATRLVELCGGGGALRLGRPAELLHDAHQLADVLHERAVGVAGAGSGLPGCGEFVGVLPHIGAARIRELVFGPAALADGRDKALVDELLEGGVDGAGAGAPRAVRLLGDGLDEAVAVRGRLGQEGEERRADIAASCATAAAAEGAAEAGAKARSETGPETEAGPEAATVAAGSASLPGVLMAGGVVAVAGVAAVVGEEGPGVHGCTAFCRSRILSI